MTASENSGVRPQAGCEAEAPRERWRWPFDAPRGRVLLVAGALAAVVLALDSYIHSNISVGIDHCPAWCCLNF